MPVSGGIRIPVHVARVAHRLTLSTRSPGLPSGARNADVGTGSPSVTDGDHGTCVTVTFGSARRSPSTIETGGLDCEDE